MMWLKEFPNLPDSTLITSCEQNGKLIHLDYHQYREYKNHTLSGYPDISVAANQNLNVSFTGDGRRSVFAKKRTEGFYADLWNTWTESGYRAVINQLANVGSVDADTGESQLTLWKCLKWINSAVDYLSSNFPFDRIRPSLSQKENMLMCLQPNNWKTSPVRCVAWHPSGTKFAVALQNDYVKVYGVGGGEFNDPQLKRDGPLWTIRHAEQKNVTALAWKPFSLPILAIGCERNVFIWHLESAGLSSKPSPVFAQMLDFACPIVWLSWDTEGRSLAVCSYSSPRVSVYNIMMDSAQSTIGPLMSVSGVVRAVWSPNGNKICLSYTNGSIRVYETDTWMCQCWSGLEGPSLGLVWTADSSTLIFSPLHSRRLYGIKFSGTSVEMAESKFGPGGGKNPIIVIGGSETPFLLFDVDTIITSEGFAVGGPVKTIVTDGAGERLCVQFSGESSSYAGVFRLKSKPNCSLTPIGFIQSGDDSDVESLSFGGLSDGNSVLSVVWSNGEVRFIPFGSASSSLLRNGAALQQSSNGSRLNGTELYSSF